jgi:hypothetical protein
MRILHGLTAWGCRAHISSVAAHHGGSPARGQQAAMDAVLRSVLIEILEHPVRVALRQPWRVRRPTE